MARITKYTLGALVLAVVVIAAILMASVAGLLGGALVVLLALIGLMLAVRFKVNRDERAGQADWKDVLDDQPADGSGFTGWVPSPARGGRVTPALDDRPPPPDPRPSPPIPEDAGEAPTAPWATGVPDEPRNERRLADPAPEPEWVFPLDDFPTHTASFPARHDDPEADPFADDDAFAPSAPYPGNGDGSTNGNGSNGDWSDNGHGHDRGPGFEPVDPPGDRDHADALAYVGAAAAANGQRRSIIDWSGPVKTVEAQVRTNEDILEASAATALPTGGDRPAPAAGSELARLLAKVEARLRDYE